MNMNKVLAWIKSNVFTVIFIVVMIAALIALPLVASNMNAAVQTKLKARAAKMKELEGLKKTDVKLPYPGADGLESRQVLVNEQLLNRYREVTEAQREEAQEVVDLAEAHNRKGRGVLLPVLFPSPPPNQAQVLPAQFHTIVIDANAALLEEVGAGAPPSAEEMAEQLELRRAQFYSQQLQKEPGAELEPDEAEKLREHLVRMRVGEYQDRAETLRFYADESALDLPLWRQAQLPSMAEMFEWQWRYWIREDILRALASANETGTVRRDPVKRLIDFTIWPDADVPSSGGSASPGPGSGAPGFGGALGGGRRGGSSGGSSGGGAAVAAQRIDPGKEVKLDYGVSLTGRTSNQLYDVRLVDLRLIVETERLPAVLDALAERNFITVLDMTMTPADAYAAARDGYIYGPVAVSEILLRLETIWLRTWTSEFMPDEVKQSKGIPLTAPGGPGASTPIG